MAESFVMVASDEYSSSNVVYRVFQIVGLFPIIDQIRIPFIGSNHVDVSAVTKFSARVTKICT
jgi:hypothetical protein